MQMQVNESWLPMEVTIKTKVGAVFVVDLDDVEMDLYGGDDMQSFSLKGRTVAPS